MSRRRFSPGPVLERALAALNRVTTLKVGQSAEPPVHYWIDSVGSGRITGWAFATKTTGGSAEPLIVEAWHASARLGRTIANRERPDVASAYPKFPQSRLSGFELEFRIPAAAAAQDTIRFEASSPHRTIEPFVIAELEQRILRAFDEQVVAVGRSDPKSPLAPFPGDVVSVIGERWPDLVSDLSSREKQEEFVERVVQVSQKPGVTRVDALTNYLRFLHAAWTHFQSVWRRFPSTNSSVSSGSKDTSSKQTRSEEMMSIAHHLYVLKSHGVAGDFAEFGCFKGFSSSMLSYACQLLDIRMHIFDSFQGLPASTSSYYSAGDFRGSLAEVRRNVETFGSPGVVTYHKGFFSESLPVSNLPPLISLWMDVDLESSSTDVMTIADRIDPRGAVFSHECFADNFVGGSIVAHPSHPHSVIQPVVTRFFELGAPVTGRFLSGATGAFWRRSQGVPVLSSEALLKLLRSI